MARYDNSRDIPPNSSTPPLVGSYQSSFNSTPESHLGYLRSFRGNPDSQTPLQNHNQNENSHTYDNPAFHQQPYRNTFDFIPNNLAEYDDLGLTNGPSTYFASNTFPCITDASLCQDPSCIDVVPCSQSIPDCGDESCTGVIPCTDIACQDEDRIPYDDNFPCCQTDLTGDICWNPRCNETPCEAYHGNTNDGQVNIAHLPGQRLRPMSGNEGFCQRLDHPPYCNCLNLRHTMRNSGDVELQNFQNSHEHSVLDNFHSGHEFEVNPTHLETSVEMEQKFGFKRNDISTTVHEDCDREAAVESDKSRERGAPTKRRCRGHSSREEGDAPNMCMWTLPFFSNGAYHICGLEFDSPDALHDHLINEHCAKTSWDSIVKGYSCGWHGCHRHCDGFSTRPKLKRHCLIHSRLRSFACSYEGCNTTMATQDAISKHESTHIQDRLHRCTWEGCTSAFNTKGELTTHTDVHRGRRNHKCDVCGKTFTDSSNLSKHKKTHYIAQFWCEEPGCNVQTVRLDQIRRHWQTVNHMPHLQGDDETLIAQYRSRMEQLYNSIPENQRKLSDGERAPRSRTKKRKCSETVGSTGDNDESLIESIPITPTL